MTRDPRSQRSPLWATAGLTWVNNLGASTALIGSYFVAKNAYAFTPRDSFLLGLLQGVTYVAAAFVAGAGIRFLAGPGRLMSTRTLLVGLHVILCLVCLLPIVWRSPPSIWLTVGLYSPLTGWLWPAIESFLSAGRSGADLRRSSAAFNMAWASCQVVTFWAIAPFIDTSPLWAIPVMGLSHILALPLALRFRAEPGAHGDAGHAHDPRERARYRRLLHAHRYLLILSYVVFSSLNPLLPTIIKSLEVDDLWATPLTSSWMIGRVIMFGFMGWWGGWHGRAFTLAWPGVLLLAGFATAMTAPHAWILGVGLAAFGVAMGAIYSAAFYYAMEVGSAGVDAGGKHEAMIGVGYTAGPLFGILAGELASRGVVEATSVPQVTLTLVVCLSIGFALLIARPLLRRRAG